MVLLATSADGLQRQLDMLQYYCQRRGLTVKTIKTKLMLFVVLTGTFPFARQQRSQPTAVATYAQHSVQPGEGESAGGSGGAGAVRRAGLGIQGLFVCQ